MPPTLLFSGFSIMEILSVSPELHNGAGRRKRRIKMIKVVFKKHYIFRSNSKRECEIELILPSDKDGNLVPEFRDSKVCVFGMELTENWGRWIQTEENTKRAVWLVYASSWEELEGEVRKMIDESIEKLKDVYKRNSEEIKRTPQDAEEVYILE